MKSWPGERREKGSAAQVGTLRAIEGHRKVLYGSDQAREGRGLTVNDMLASCEDGEIIGAGVCQKAGYHCMYSGEYGITPRR